MRSVGRVGKRAGDGSIVVWHFVAGLLAHPDRSAVFPPAKREGGPRVNAP
jgi:hypothetical protein